MSGASVDGYFVGTGPVLVDHFVHCDTLPVHDDLPAPGGKLHARDGAHMKRVMKNWVDGWAPQVQVGGPVLVALRQAKTLGLSGRFVGAIGDDELGSHVAGHLVVEGFEPSDLCMQKGRRSGSAIVWIDRHGERSILFDAGSLDPLTETDVAHLIDPSVAVAHIDSREPIAAAALAKRIKAGGARVHYDVDPWTPWAPDLLRMSDAAQISYREVCDSSPFDGDIEACAEAMRLEFGVPVLALTNSDRPAVAVESHGAMHPIEPFEVHSVDSTGAGDVFAGAYEYATLRGDSLPEVLRFAAAAGALHTTRLGNDRLPTLAEIEDLAGA